MANELYLSAITGLTVNAQLYSGTTPVGASIAMTEIGTTGEYIGSIPGGVTYGYYLVIATTTSGTVKIASGDFYWSGTKEMSPVMYERLHRARGLETTAPATNTLTALDAGSIHVDITGDLQNTATYTATS